MASLTSPICARLGIQYPIFGFAHDVKTVAAISRAGGYGVYGATRRFPQEIRDELAEIRELAGDHPFGVDLVFCLLYTSPSPRDQRGSRMPSSA